MNKPLSTFLGILALLYLLFGSLAYFHFKENDVVSKSPAYVLGTPESISQSNRRGFKVHYSYVVDGTTYKIDTDWLRTRADADIRADGPVELAYPTTAPAKAIFKSDFDKRDQSATLLGEMWRALLFALGFSVIATLYFLWKYPDLRGD